MSVDPALAAALEVVGDRWSLQVIAALAEGPLRFSDLDDRLDGAAPNVLSRRLKELTGAGILTAEPYQRRPLRMQYELTDRGRGLLSVVATLSEWASGVEPRFGVCGAQLAGGSSCPSAGVSLTDPDDEVVEV